MTGDKTFIRITNKDIYDKLSVIEKNVSSMNGKIKFHTWAISFTVLILVAIITRVV